MSKFKCNKKARRAKKTRDRENAAIARIARENGISTFEVVMLLEGGPIPL